MCRETNQINLRGEAQIDAPIDEGPRTAFQQTHAKRQRVAEAKHAEAKHAGEYAVSSESDMGDDLYDEKMLYKKTPSPSTTSLGRAIISKTVMPIEAKDETDHHGGLKMMLCRLIA